MQDDGLYILHEVSFHAQLTQRTCFNSIYTWKDGEIMLWHYRLGIQTLVI